MSDTFFKPTRPTAKKEHRCLACLHKIAKGEAYVQQEGFYEGRPCRTRYHAECWDQLCDDEGSFEFAAGDIDPPERLLTANMEN